MKILLLNAGSSSLKATLVEAGGAVLAAGHADWAGSATRYEYAAPEGEKRAEDVPWRGHADAVRRFVFDLGGQLGLLGVTTLLAGEYGREDTARFPEFTIADGVVALELGLDGVRETRTLQVAKLRGSGYLDGLQPLRIDDAGARVFPRQTAVARVTPYRIGDERVSTGGT